MQKIQIKKFCTVMLISASSMLPQFSHAACVQDTVKTLLGSARLNTLGLYVSPEVGATTYAGSFTPVAGMGVNLIFNKKWSLGVAVSGTTDKQFTPIALDANRQLHLQARQAYVKCEYTFSPGKLLHFSIPFTAGVGRIQVDSLDQFRDIDFHNGFGGRGGFRQGQRTGFIQPVVNAELNLIKNVRLYAGAGYRINIYNDENIAKHALTTEQLSGLTVQAGLKVGVFGFSVRKKSQE